MEEKIEPEPALGNWLLVVVAAVDDTPVVCVVVTEELLGPWLLGPVVKLGATPEPREKVNCGCIPRGAPNGKIEAATPGAAVEATTGAGLGPLKSEVSPGAKGFGSEEAVVVVLEGKEIELGGRIPAKLEGVLAEDSRPPMVKVGGGGTLLEETAVVTSEL